MSFEISPIVKEKTCMNPSDDKHNLTIDPLPNPDKALRTRAVEKIKNLEKLQTEPPGPEETRRMLHELQVHQIELELQNDELLRTQLDLDAARERYFNFYSLAPVGFCSVSSQGLIIETNHTVAALLGEYQAALVNQPFSRFIYSEDQDAFYLYNKRLFAHNGPLECELRMVKTNGTIFWGHLTATAAQDGSGAPVCRIVMSDITERKFRDEGRELTAHLITLINTPGDFHSRLSDLTASLQDWTGCEAVGIRLRSGDDYPYFETRGFPPAFVQAENHLCTYGPDGEILRDPEGNPMLECMCGNILCGRYNPAKPFFTAHGSFCSNNTTALLATTTDADRQARTRNRCNGMGYESVALVPIRTGDQVFGLLQFNDHRTDFFTSALITRLESMADSLAIALSRRQSEAVLRESEKLYRSLFDNMLNGFAYCRMLFKDEKPYDFIYLAVNDAFKSLTGLGDIVGRKVSEVIPGIQETDPQIFEIYGRVATTGRPERFEIYVEAMQMWFWVSVYSTAHRHFVAVFDVITERKRSEEVLLESEQNFRTLANSGRTMVWTSGKDKLCNYFNRVWLEFTGRTLEQETGNGWAEGVHPDDFKRRLDTYVGAFDLRENFSIEHRLRRHDGEYRWILDDGCPRWDSKGEFIGYIGHCLDITDRKMAEAEKSRFETQLHQAQKMESIGRLAGGVAHDFNNMLGIITGYAELAQDKVDPGQSIHDDLEQIRKAAGRSSDLTRQLLAFARKQTIAPRVLDLNDTVEGMLKMLRRLIGENIDLSWMPGKNLWQVNADPSQIDQILANLCVNSRDAISDVGKMTIETGNVIFDEDYPAAHADYVPGEYLMLAVSDNGCGMDQETQARIFEPFFTTKEMGKGTGLGLATVYGIARQNNGFINVYSEPGHGTTFRIYLPRHAGKSSQMQKEKSEKPAARGNETILLVEDEPAILKMTKIMLEKQGYTVLAASKPCDAVSLAETYPEEIHLIMTDVIMPDMNGKGLAREISSYHPGIKILFMSGYMSNVIAHHGVLDPRVDFIQKPFSIKNLTAKVRDVLDDARKTDRQ